MRQKTDSRKKSDWQEPRAIAAAKIREVFNFPVGRIDAKFCLETLWWWRPLERCLDKDFAETGNYRVPKNRRGFFPTHVFETLQEHHEAGEMHSLLHLWRVTEISERIDELAFDFPETAPSWPAYATPTSYYSSVTSLKVTTLGPLKINLGDTDKVILANVSREIQKLRTEVMLIDDRVRIAGESNRNRYFNCSAFSIIEAIDKHVLLGEEKEKLPWANVRKAVKEAYR